MNLRDVAAPLEAALLRAREAPESARPCVVVDAHHQNSGVFIQYSVSNERQLVLDVCLNAVTRDIEGCEAAATAFFGHAPRSEEGDEFVSWSKPCDSVTRAVELGMQALRHVLMLSWDTELYIDEIRERTLTRAELFGRGKGS